MARTRELPPDGLVVSAKLAEILDVAIGDHVTVEVLEHNRPVREIPDRRTVDDTAGTNAYMSIHALRRLMRRGHGRLRARLLVDPLHENALYWQAEGDTPSRQRRVEVGGAAELSRKLSSRNMMQIKTINVVFATIIALGVVYNAPDYARRTAAASWQRCV